MSERDPRKMAVQIAGVRASETHLSEDKRVFFDPYAEKNQCLGSYSAIANENFKVG